MNNLSHTIRKFNRFELKYLVSIEQAERFKQALLANLAPDDHGDSCGSYGIASLYYDGPDYRFYWEKVDGIKFRRKLRIRRYESSTPLTAESPVFVEIKQRTNRVTQKRRVLLPYGDALRLCSGREIPDHASEDSAVINEVATMLWMYDLRPASLVGGEYDIGLRVTFDRDLYYRSQSPSLDGEADGQMLFPADRVIIEIKANERVPYWLTELVAEHNLNLMRVSKYCRSVELAQHFGAPMGVSPVEYDEVRLHTGMVQANG